MNIHQTLILFNEYHHRLEGGYDSDDDESEDEEQEQLFQPQTWKITIHIWKVNGFKIDKRYYISIRIDIYIHSNI